MSRPGQLQRLQLTGNQVERFGRIRSLDQLKSMDPVEFEKFCAFLYEQQGYTAYLSALTGDEGIDLWLTRGEEKVVVQCKRYAGTVGQPVVRDLFGTMVHNKANRAALVTTGGISRQAEEWAADKPIHLVDGHELINWARYARLGAGSGAGGRATFWLRRHGRTLALAAGILAAVILCLATAALAVNTFRARTTVATPPRPTTPLVVVPATATAVAAATAAPTLQATPTRAPTATPSPTPATAGTVTADFTIPRLSNPLPLTADPAAWPDLPAIALPFITEQQPSWDGSRDVSAVWRLAYDDTFLYGLVIVVDDIHVQTQEPRFAYRGDALELELDTNHDRADQARSDDYQYVISPGNFADRPPGAFRFRGGDNGVMNDFFGTRSEVVAARTADGYTVAFRIPWYDIGMRRPPAGTRLGIALSVSDNDTPGTAVQELVLSHIATRRWSTPSSWGTATLGD